MSRKRRSLPKPPATPFRRKRLIEGDDDRPSLMADDIARAMSQGKLDEFFREEMPDNEYARKLAGIMLGMSGMTPPEGMPDPPGRDGKPPDDVLDAARAGDRKKLTDLLQREHRKRSRGKHDTPVKAKTARNSHLQDARAPSEDLFEQLAEISSDCNLSIGWLVHRAIKRYVEEYQKSGRL